MKFASGSGAKSTKTNELQLLAVIIITTTVHNIIKMSGEGGTKMITGSTVEEEASLATIIDTKLNCDILKYNIVISWMIRRDVVSISKWFDHFPGS